VKVGDVEYPVIKTGRAQAKQVLRITKWISRHGTRAVRHLQSDPDVVLTDLGGVAVLGSSLRSWTRMR